MNAVYKRLVKLNRYESRINVKKLFRTKPIDSTSSNRLKACLTAFDLTMLGIGAIVGAGIFVLTGIAAATQAGPAIILSYLLAGLACSFAALAYSELASSFGGCGGAYGYAYAGIGELFAWLIGWDLLLEYGMDVAAVSIGWSGYFQNMLEACGMGLPKLLTTDPFHGGFINLPAVFIIFTLAFVLTLGSKESSRFNTIIVFIKLTVIALFIAIGIFYFNPEHWRPFMPFGPQGIVNGAGLIFFAYIGFDAISTAGEEAKNPQRDLPRAIIASLVVCTIIYIIVAAILTGMAHYHTLNVSSPVASVLLNLGYKFTSEIVSVGAIAGLTTAILTMFFGFSRVYLAMSRDGLLPKAFTNLDPKTYTPKKLIWFTGAIMALCAGIFPISEIANLVNIGTLAAFVAVCICVIVLRYTRPNLIRPFKTWSPWVPLFGVILCIYLIVHLPPVTWISFMVWMLLGLVFYFLYSRYNSELEKVFASQ